MANREFVVRKLFAGYVLVGAACALALGLWLFSSYRFPQVQATQAKRKIVINNKTEAMQITKAELEGRNLRLALKNGSRKNINWFRVSFGRNESIEADFNFATPSVLVPGEIYEDLYTIESNSLDVNITVVSVLFEDRTVEGDASYAKATKEKRAGQKAQLKRLLPLLQKVINAPEGKVVAALNDLEAEVSEIQDENDQTVPEARRIGLRNAKERILNDIQKIRQLHAGDKSKDVQRDLLPIRERYENILIKLEGYAF